MARLVAPRVGTTGISPQRARPVASSQVTPTSLPSERHARELFVMDSKPVAILICHGMGRQVPFEELNEVACALLTDEQSSSRADKRPRVVRFVNTNTHANLFEVRTRALVARAEITVPVPEGEHDRGEEQDGEHK